MSEEKKEIPKIDLDPLKQQLETAFIQIVTLEARIKALEDYLKELSDQGAFHYH